jgi:hypothetical protein
MSTSNLLKGVYSDVALQLNNLIVTGTHKHLLRKAYLSIDLCEYLETSNNWNNNEIDFIWWDVLINP